MDGKYILLHLLLFLFYAFFFSSFRDCITYTKKWGLWHHFRISLTTSFCPCLRLLLTQIHIPTCTSSWSRYDLLNFRIIFLVFTDGTWSAHVRLRTKDFGSQVWLRLVMHILGSTKTAPMVVRVGIEFDRLYLLFIFPFPLLCDIRENIYIWRM